jgi:predicted RNase H-like HicB family nuclease
MKPAMKTRFTVILDREVDGRVIASVPGVPGCHAYGRTPAGAVRRVKAALRFYLKEILREGSRVPTQPKPVAVEISLAL